MNERLINNAKATMALCSAALGLDDNQERIDKGQAVIIDITSQLLLDNCMFLNEEEIERITKAIGNFEEMFEDDNLEKVINKMTDSEKKIMIYNAYRVLNSDAIISEIEKKYLDSMLEECNFNLEEVIQEGETKGFDMESIFSKLNLEELDED